MREWAKKIYAVMEKILILGFGVQILFGVIWAFGQFGSFQEFSESYFLQKVSKSLICDEYTGILYPLLIRFAQGIEGAVKIPYFCVLYVIQLGTAAYGAWYFLNGTKMSRFQKIWATLSVLTFPMAMQCHMAVLPVSLATSLFLIQLGVFERACLMKKDVARSYERGEGAAEKVQPGACHFLAAMGIPFVTAGLLLPEYGIFLGIPMVVYAIYEILASGGGRSLKGQEKPVLMDGNRARTIATHIAGILLVTAAFLGLENRLTDVFTREGAYGRMQNTVEAAAFRRSAWDDFGEYYSDWPQDLVGALTQEEIGNGNLYPLQKEWILGEKVDGVLGKERAREIYGQVQAVTWKQRFSRNGKEILKDFLCYGFAPPLQLCLMEGKGQTTLSGRNLDIMRAEQPKLTTLYVRYGYGLFLAAAVFAGIVCLIRFFLKDGKSRGVMLKALAWYGLVGAVICVWYTMQGGGIMDYKNSLILTSLWICWICRGIDHSS